MRLVPNYPTAPVLPPASQHPTYCTMTTPDPWAVGDIQPDVANYSTTTSVLNTGIQTLTALKATVETTPMKVIFESAIIILTLVRVRVLILFPSCTRSSVA